MYMPSSFLNAVILQDDAGWFVVVEPFTYRFGNEESPLEITVPKGFKTDLASIPWFAGFIVPKLGKYNAPSVLHDFNYSLVRKGKFNRAIADAIMLESMAVAGVNFWQRWLIYLSLRAFGWTCARPTKR